MQVDRTARCDDAATVLVVLASTSTTTAVLASTVLVLASTGATVLELLLGVRTVLVLVQYWTKKSWTTTGK